jgi:hypothetical protein
MGNPSPGPGKDGKIFREPINSNLDDCFCIIKILPPSIRAFYLC